MKGIATGLLALAAVALVVMGVAWRLVARRRASIRLGKALAAPDPADRLAALELMSAHRYPGAGELLLWRSKVETEPTVLDAIAQSVIRDHWEPAGSEALVDLWLWAHHHLQIQPGSTASAQAPSRGIAPDLTGAVSTGSQSQAQSQAPPAAPLAQATPAAPLEQPSWGLPPDSLRVLVAGACDPTSVALIDALRRGGCTVIATDSQRSAPGFALASGTQVLPSPGAPGYLGSLIEAASLGRAQAVIPATSEALWVLAQAAQWLDKASVLHWLPSPAALNRCLDRWLLYDQLRMAGLAVLPSAQASTEGVPGPWRVCSRWALADFHPQVLTGPNEVELAVARSKVPLLVTSYPSGQPFSVAIVVAPDMTVLGATPRWLPSARGADNLPLEIELSSPIGSMLTAIARDSLAAVGLDGVATVHGVTTGTRTTAITEIVPGFSQEVISHTGSGGDLIRHYLSYLHKMVWERSYSRTNSRKTMGSYHGEITA